MHIIGRGRYAREAYPDTKPNAALVALANRYLVDTSAPGTPSPFTVTQPSFHIVAAANVTRRASGLFVVSVQVPRTALAADDTQSWTAVALFGSTASGGVASGDWLLDIASTITTSTPTGASPMSAWTAQSDAGNLTQTVTLVGVNSTPVPTGDSVIAVLSNTDGGSQVSPGVFFGAAYELP